VDGSLVFIRRRCASEPGFAGTHPLTCSRGCFAVPGPCSHRPFLHLHDEIFMLFFYSVRLREYKAFAEGTNAISGTCRL
jgi:hypothetical protein